VLRNLQCSVTIHVNTLYCAYIIIVIQKKNELRIKINYNDCSVYFFTFHMCTIHIYKARVESIENVNISSEINDYIHNIMHSIW
jgi:hypothetical protein